MPSPHPLAAHQASLETLCRKFRVGTLELFGSVARGTDDAETSDIDYLLGLLEIPVGERADADFGLLQGLEALLGRPVDLVMANAIRNRYFLQGIQDARIGLYAA